MKKISLLTIACACFPLAAHANDAQLESFVEARLLEINKNDASALKGYSKLFSQQADSEILVDRLFEIALREGDVKTALEAIDAVEGDGALPVQAHILRYSSALKKQNLKAAAASLRSIKNDPIFGFMVPIMQSWIETASGANGTLLLDPDINTGLTNFYARDQVVYQHLALKQYDEVIEKIVSVRPFDEAFARDLIIKSAPILAKNGYDEFARALLRAQGGSLALSFLPIVNGTKAAQRYDDRISVNIGVARLYARISETFISQEIFDQAVFFARTAHWLAPDDPAVIIQLNAALGANEQVDVANEIFEDMDASNPYYSILASQNIRMLLQEKRGKQAVVVAERARKQAPNSQTLLLLLAQTYDNVNQHERAAATFQELFDNTAKDQKLRQSYIALYQARSLDRAGQWDEAKQILEKALTLKAKNPFLLNFYGYSLLNRNEDIKRGFNMVKRAHKLEPRSPDITDSLGWGYFLQGDLRKAIPLLENAANVSKQDSEIQEHLGDVYWSSGRLVDARYIWRAAALIASGTDKKRLVHKSEFGLDIPYVES